MSRSIRTPEFNAPSLMSPRHFALAAAVLAPLLAFAAEPVAVKPAPVELFPDLPIVKGKDVEIKASELERAFMEYRANAAARGQGSVPDNQRRDIEEKLLARMIVTRILVSKATPDDRTKGREAGLKAYADLRKRAGSDESFKRQVESMGMTTESLQNQLLERGVSEEVFTREVKAKIVVSDADVAKFYADNPARFEQPELVRVSHIMKLAVDPSLLRVPNAKIELPDDKKQAARAAIEKLLERAKAGEDFTKLILEASDDPDKKANNGEYTFPRGQMSKDFEEASFGLKPNEISGVVTTKLGYHVIKQHEKTPSKKIELDKVKDRIREGLQQQEAEKQMPAFFEKLKTEAEVKILRPAATP